MTTEKKTNEAGYIKNIAGHQKEHTIADLKYPNTRGTGL